MNLVALIGNLGADPEFTSLTSGSVVAKFSICYNEVYKVDGQKVERSHWFNVECWGKTAEFVANYLRSGNRVSIQGSLKENVWTDESGTKHRRTILRADRVDNLTPKKGETQSHDNAIEDEEF